MTQSPISNYQSPISPFSSLQPHHYRRLALYQPRNFLLALVGWLLFSLAPLVLGYLNQQIFDSLSGDAQAGWNVWTLLVLLLVAQTGEQVIALGWLYWQITWEHVMMALLRSNLFAHMLQHFGRSKQPNIMAPAISTGDAINRYRNDIEATGEVINDTYRLIGHGLFAAVALTIMWRINPWVTVVAVAPLSAIVVVIHRLGAPLAAAWQQRSEDTSRVTGFISTIFDAVQAVQVAGAEGAVTRHFDRLGETRRRSALRHTLLNNVIRSFNGNIVNIGRGLVLLLAAQAVHAGSFTVGDLALFVVYLEAFLELPRRVGRLLAARQISTVSLTRLLAMMPDAAPDQLVAHQPIYLDHAAPLVQPTAQAEPLETLTIQGLTYHHPASGHGVENISFQLKRGSLTVITGRVGAGKSTLLRVLLGLLPADAGEIRWNGNLVTAPATFFVPPQVAYTPQAPRLFSTTLRENILLGLEKSPPDLDATIRQAVFEEDLAQMVDGLETVVGPRGVRLSGGQVQRVAAARMFVRQVALLVFDDLSSALDVETEALLWDRLFAGSRRPTCLVVSHRRAVLQRADHIIVLQKGRIDDQGALAELLARNAALQALW
ncbi:MAG: ABC transporter ATP-binding protein [Caldilineaceae bacterium]